MPQAILASPTHSDSHHYFLLYDKEFMIKKLGNSDGVKMSSTVEGQRELWRQYRNKINEIIEYINIQEEYAEKRRLEFIKQVQETNPELVFDPESQVFVGVPRKQVEKPVVVAPKVPVKLFGGRS